MINPDLPEICFAFVDELLCVAAIQRGKQGYSVPTNLPDWLTITGAKAWVDHQNTAMGVTPAIREAMIAGSMFGWDTPMADPKLFDRATLYAA